ncbi:MAG: hypothetical protein EHM21_07840 [Chloroflexi bacterium]|nr:MAG: hypothetical protein EHM21_07840 [Chloroflexota bacterium]
MHDTIAQRRSFIQPLVENLLKRSPEERRSWFDSAWKTYNDFRTTRPYEVPIPGYARQKMSEAPDEQRAAFMSMTNRVNFFTMLDERDSAQAIEKGLTADYCGSHILFINDSQNWTRLESGVLAELFYPDVTCFKKALTGQETLVSIDKARQIIGFEPEFTFGI